jgi:hypothetical protein
MTDEEDLSKDEDDTTEEDELFFTEDELWASKEDEVSALGRVAKSLPSSPQATRNSTTRTEAIFLKDIIPHENQLKVIACREMNREI